VTNSCRGLVNYAVSRYQECTQYEIKTPGCLLLTFWDSLGNKKQRAQYPYNAFSSFAITISCQSFVRVQLESLPLYQVVSSSNLRIVLQCFGFP